MCLRPRPEKVRVASYVCICIHVRDRVATQRIGHESAALIIILTLLFKWYFKQFLKDEFWFHSCLSMSYTSFVLVHAISNVAQHNHLKIEVLASYSKK